MTTDGARLTLNPGTRFGRYEVVTEIAAGGMATVFLARALGAAGFQRLVAIKLMHPHIANDDDFVAMFMDEARLAARIRHPNVVATMDLQNDDDGLYLVMEYVEGDVLLGLLRSTIKAGKTIPAPIALRIMLDILNGLHAAHELTDERGEPLRLVHRDVSPHNILVGIDGISRITDFGIARAEARLGATRDGQVKGKLAYMAPEQTTSHSLDRRADIFAAGIVLWESIAGKRLFMGQSDGEVLRNLLVNPIPKLRQAKADIPQSLETVCAKALDRDPDQRYSTAAQFADALEEAGGSLGVASTRAVASFVRSIAGDRIAVIQSRVQGMSPADATGATSAVRKKKENTDPERTVRRDDLEGASLAVVRERLGTPPRPPPTPGTAASPAAIPLPNGSTDGARATASSDDVQVLDVDLVDDSPKRRTGLYVVLALLAIAGGGVGLMRALSHSNTVPSSMSRAPASQARDTRAPAASPGGSPAGAPAATPAAPPPAAPAEVIPPAPPPTAADPTVVAATQPSTPAGAASATGPATAAAQEAPRGSRTSRPSSGRPRVTTPRPATGHPTQPHVRGAYDPEAI